MIKPDPSSRHPIVLFLLALCAVSGAGIFLGDAPAPGSLEATLPAWEVRIWSGGLLLGAMTTIVGLWLQSPKRPTRLRDGVLSEQIGMALLGPCALIYGFAALLQVGWAALLPGGIVVSLGVACVYRWFTLQRDINKSKALVAQVNGANGDAIH